MTTETKAELRSKIFCIDGEIVDCASKDIVMFEAYVQAFLRDETPPQQSLKSLLIPWANIRRIEKNAYVQEPAP